MNPRSSWRWRSCRRASRRFRSGSKRRASASRSASAGSVRMASVPEGTLVSRMETSLAGMAARETRSRNHARKYISLEVHKQAHQHREDQAVLEHVAQDLALTAFLVGRHAGDHDALGINHLAHDAARAVAGGGEERRDTDLLRGDLLEIAEEN